MRKFKGTKRQLPQDEGANDPNAQDGEEPDFAGLAIGAQAKKKGQKKPDPSAAKTKKKMPDAAKKAMKLAIRAKLKKKTPPNEP